MNPRIRIRVIVLLFVAALAFSGCIPNETTIIYVDKDAPSGGEGTTWGSAFNTLTPALTVGILIAIGGGTAEIWVAEGIYYPDEGLNNTNDDINSTFLIAGPGIELYGGFTGTEVSLEERPNPPRPTVLSGDLEQNDVSNSAGIVGDNNLNLTLDEIVGQNALTVLSDQGAPSISLIDGFTITAGKNSLFETAGLNLTGESDLIIRNTNFIGHVGTAIRTGPETRLSLENARIASVEAIFGDALVVNQSSRVRVLNSTIISNLTEAPDGSIYYRPRTGTELSPPEGLEIITTRILVTNGASCIFTDLGRPGVPGPLFVVNSLLDGTLSGNSAQSIVVAGRAPTYLISSTVTRGSGNGVLALGASQVFSQNSAFFSNGSTGFCPFTSVNDLCVEGQLTIAHSYLEDFLPPSAIDLGGNFSSTFAGGFPPPINANPNGTLNSSSPVIDAASIIDLIDLDRDGDTTELLSDFLDLDSDGNITEFFYPQLPTDLSGDPRVSGDFLDMGMDEFQF